MRPFYPIAPPLAMLHSVFDTPEESLANWCISRKAFLQLLDVVEQTGRQTTHFSELIQTQKGRPFSKKVILTFDDCARHLLDFALPELVRRKMKAVFYMPTAHLGGYNAWDADNGGTRLELMNAGDLKELVRLGMEVGSHSHHHVALKSLPAKKVEEEVHASKQILEEVTGRPVYSFAYPYGSVPSGYRSVMTAAGYRYGVSIYQPFETTLALRRFGVYEKDTPLTLRRKLSGRYHWLRTVYDAVKKN